MRSRFKLTAAILLCGCALSLHAQQPSGGGASPMSMPPAMTGGPPPGPPRPMPLPASPSLAASLKMARAAVASCRGFHVGVTILDSGGYPKLIYTPDGSHGFHAYISFKKANTALKFRMPSGGISAAMKADPRLAAAYQAHAADFVTFAGGLPIMAGKKLIGAIGVSGAEPSAKDEECAAAAIEAARSTLR